MKRIVLLILISMLIVLEGCQIPEIEEETIIIIDNGIRFSETLGEDIPIETVSVPYSETKGSLTNFINYSKPVDLNPIYFIKSNIKTHQIIFEFDGIYPVDSMRLSSYDGDDASIISSISIDYSLNEITYNRYQLNYELTNGLNQIDFGGLMAKSVKLVFQAGNTTYGLQDVKFELADGFIIKEDQEYSNTFLRYNGWTGADGIFTFNLTDGNDAIGAEKNTTGFIFSDTFVGEVYTHNKLRKSGIIINNSLGYMSHDLPFAEAFEFVYRLEGIAPKSVYPADAYTGKTARNLLDGDGLFPSHTKDGLLTNINEGTMWLSDDIQGEVIIDLKDSAELESIYLWNYNANSDYGVKNFTLSSSLDGTTWTPFDTYEINQASGNDLEPYTLSISLNELTAQYIKLTINETYNTDFAGLGKILILDSAENPLFGEVQADSIDELTANDLSGRLWLQDGVVINNHLYIFPILVKDYQDFFKVHSVGMIKTPIQNERLDDQNSEYLNSPLQVNTDDGGTIFYGAGLMNNVLIDGYIYIYGYKDLNGRYLVAGRFLPEDIENYNHWEYYDGAGWSSNINDSYPIKNGVSAELSVSHINSGLYEGKYMLFVMENTTSGKISYAISDTPYGPFDEYIQIYQTTEGTYLRDAFTYNAKMHPNLSEPGNFLISYNVNTKSAGALSDARIYYPRFIRMIEVKK
jgi:hypothetical protein